MIYIQSFIWDNITSILTILIAISVIFVVIIENSNPLKAIAWIAIVGFIPVVGIIAYVMVGQDKRREKKIHRRFYELLMNKPKDITIQYKKNEIPYDLLKYETSINLIKNLDDAPLLNISDIKIFEQGDKMFKQMFDDIKNAKKNIHILSYIIENDVLFSNLIDILKEKAKENVRIRIIYDHIGSYSVSSRLWNNLRKSGIEAYPFMRVFFPILSSSINYRNHRKITIIDGQIAYVGGMNIAKKYLGQTDWGYWRDTHFRVTGQAVYALQTHFLSDWYTVSHKIPNVKNCFPDIVQSNNGIMSQFVCSGPVELYNNVEQTAISLISKARKHIYIETPYLLPTNVLNNALISASLSGVKVYIMIPDKGDSRVTSWAIDSYILPLLKANINIYRYKKGFLHSKLMMIDGDVSLIGSANMDFRSFEHNFEVVGVVYNKEFCLSLQDVFNRDKEYCDIMNLTEWERRSNVVKFRDGLMRLFSPLL